MDIAKLIRKNRSVEITDINKTEETNKAIIKAENKIKVLKELNRIGTGNKDDKYIIFCVNSYKEYLECTEEDIKVTLLEALHDQLTLLKNHSSIEVISLAVNMDYKIITLKDFLSKKRSFLLSISGKEEVTEKHFYKERSKINEVTPWENGSFSTPYKGESLLDSSLRLQLYYTHEEDKFYCSIF